MIPQNNLSRSRSGQSPVWNRKEKSAIPFEKNSGSKVELVESTAESSRVSHVESSLISQPHQLLALRFIE